MYIYLETNYTEAEFKEFEPQLKFRPWLKYGWFHLNSTQKRSKLVIFADICQETKLCFCRIILIPKRYFRFGEMVLEYSTERQPLIKSKETTMSSYTQKQGQKYFL